MLPLWIVLPQVALLLLLSSQVSYLWAVKTSSSQIIDCTKHSTSCVNSPDSGSTASDKQAGCFSQSENSSQKEFSYICTARANNKNPQQDLTKDSASVSIYIVTPSGKTDFNYGSDLVLKCKFNTRITEDFRFRLRWMRFVTGSQANQSIFSSAERRHHQTSSITSNKLVTLQREDGLDLELADFNPSDVGSYFCQAHSADGLDLLNEASVSLGSLEPTKWVDVNEQESYSRYSLENLSKLLPSIKVVPSYLKVSPNQQVQLACLTTGIDPSPPDSLIEWSFAQLSERESLLHDEPQFEAHLPAGTDLIDNLLIIWAVTDAHTGLYKCHIALNKFNLSVSAFGEIYLNFAKESSPQVAVTPEVVRLSSNASVQILCEASGFPMPELVWYRIEETSPTMSRVTSLMDGDLEGVMIEQVGEGDVGIYCSHGNKCNLQKQHSKVTSISILGLAGARAKHQGQYVCRAENKLGSSQASSIVDVEFKESPRVQIPASFRKQIIWVPSSGENDHLNESQYSSDATFKCSIEAGKPEPQVRWLRLTDGLHNMAQVLKNLDLYDLSKASSATARVNVETIGKDLILRINTISVEDEGAYVCLAENEWGRHTQVAKLLVRTRAQIRIIQRSPLIANLNSSFQLECLAFGHPAPLDLEWSRFDKGTFFSLISHASSKSSGISQERAVLKFDRASSDDSGEYTCNARDPIEPNAAPLKDVILVSVVEPLDSFDLKETLQGLLPRIIVRPVKSFVKRGSNLTLDCLAVSGLQPTIIEWIAPVRINPNNLTPPTVIPYYRHQNGSGQLLQLGSKLKLINVGIQHEGIYQCKGRNKAGVEVAPALVRVLSTTSKTPEKSSELTSANHTPENGNLKTKLARAGSNIELKCQVAGEDQVSTSWSRNNFELPLNSVQLEHNLWIHNVSQTDSGLYLCSARAEQSNKIYHARIQLLVSPPQETSHQENLKGLHAKIVASKSHLDVGDSVTLECIVSDNNNSDHVGELEEQDLNEVFWTNARTGQSIFLDNVHIQGNLLIVYQIRAENEGIYRCNYNELSQSIDYRMQIQSSNFSISSSESSLQHIDIRKIPQGAHLLLECPSKTGRWLRGQNPGLIITPIGHILELNSIQPNDADLYQCREEQSKVSLVDLVIQVLVPAIKFSQRPTSYLTFPDTSEAHQEFGFDMKFYAEKDTGLILYSGQWSISNPSDYVLLYLIDEGYLEFKSDLGDGATVLRSKRAIQLNQWHWLSIQQNQNGSASMKLDKQYVTRSNSSSKRHLSLNLNSVLYVGGSPSSLMERITDITNRTQVGGFQGCLSQLSWNGKQLNLSRAVSVDVSECDKPECIKSDCSSSNNAICQVEGSTLIYDKRCICLPGYTGDKCQKLISSSTSISSSSSRESLAQEDINEPTCELLKANCSLQGSSKCQLISTSSYRCHCKLGFTGSDCSQPIEFPNETSVKFNQLAYLKLSLNQPSEVLNYLQLNNPQEALKFNGSAFAHQISMADSQNISFKLVTNSSYGILFYTGSHHQRLNMQGGASGSGVLKPGGQLSKSMVANLLARISMGRVVDYLAVALIDGHVELSYELGSGIAVIRSSQRVNDLRVHQIRVLRTRKLARLFIDELHRYEGSSPGKLSVLNGPSQVYLGGLGRVLEGEWREGEPHNNGLVDQRLASFTGCISQLELNSLGPFNLVRHQSQLSRLDEARNLVACDSSGQQSEEHLVSVSSTLESTGKPYSTSQTPVTEASSAPVDLDDSDET